MTEMGFPIPFGGITCVFTAGSREGLMKAVRYLSTGCGQGHDHNIAVAFDGNHLYTSALGADCLRRAEDRPSWPQQPR